MASLSRTKTTTQYFNMIQRDFFTMLRDETNSYAVVTALQDELPKLLPEQILFTGVGKINATHVLTRYLARHPEIRTIINYGTAGANALDINQGTGTSGNNSINLIMHLFNFNNASGYSYCTYENIHRNTSQSRTGVFNGSGVLQENQATDGVYFYLNSGNNFASGTFTLYKVVGE